MYTSELCLKSTLGFETWYKIKKIFLQENFLAGQFFETWIELNQFEGKSFCKRFWIAILSLKDFRANPLIEGF